MTARANTVPSIAIMPSVPHHMMLRCEKRAGQRDDVQRAAQAASFMAPSPAPARAPLPRLGQNHTDQREATGTVPHTTAHGVKIEPMNSTVVATAAGRARAKAPGTVRCRAGVHHGGDECSRASADRPLTCVGAPGGRLPHRDRARAPPGWREVGGGGGEAVAHSSVPAPHGSAGRAPRRALRHRVHQEQQDASASVSGAHRRQQVEVVPAHPPGRCRRAAACPAGRAGASGRRPR
jgi:hypothetical protein